MVTKANRFQEITEILDGNLFLGNLSAAESAETHLTHRITHIVSVCPEFTTDVLLSFYRSLSQNENSTTALVSPKHLQIPVEDSEYEDILVHLPKTCQFIKDAITDGGRVLVHCAMGISRSVTIVAAYLMKSRGMSPTRALEFIKHRRPQIHPNYSFIRQLQIFAQCAYNPSRGNQVFCSWKKRQKQDITKYLGYFEDISCLAGGSIGESRQISAGGDDGSLRGRVLLCSHLPKDQDQTDSILSTLGITHLLSLSPSQPSSTILLTNQPDALFSVSTPPSCFSIVSPRLVHHLHITAPTGSRSVPNNCPIIPDAYTPLLRQSVKWIHRALSSQNPTSIPSSRRNSKTNANTNGLERELENNGALVTALNGLQVKDDRELKQMVDKRPLVLIYSTMESRVCEVAGAWLMASEGLSSSQAISVLEEALPLFTTTQGLTRYLEAFEQSLIVAPLEQPPPSLASASSVFIVNMHPIARSAKSSSTGSKPFGQVSITNAGTLSVNA